MVKKVVNGHTFKMMDITFGHFNRSLIEVRQADIAVFVFLPDEYRVGKDKKMRTSQIIVIGQSLVSFPQISDFRSQMANLL
ncbi:MAG: hypothetical protein ROW48_08940 [Bellilinea sp.]